MLGQKIEPFLEAFLKLVCELNVANLNLRTLLAMQHKHSLCGIIYSRSSVIDINFLAIPRYFRPNYMGFCRNAGCIHRNKPAIHNKKSELRCVVIIEFLLYFRLPCTEVYLVYLTCSTRGAN